MNLYLLSQSESTGYDTYDSAVVAAESEEEAKHIHPSGFAKSYHDDKWYGEYSGGSNKGEEYELGYHDWASTANNVDAQLIGIAAEGIEKGIILASFNAG